MTQAYVPPDELIEPPREHSAAGMIGLVIAALAAMLFVACYFAGRAVRPDPDARVRIPVDAAATLAAAPPVAPAFTPAPGPFDAFDLRQLDPQVADAVRAAREIQRLAQAAAHRGEVAAQRAHAGAAGSGVIMYVGGDSYEGELVDGGRQGAGVYTWANPREDDYAGEFDRDAINGLGVKRWTDGAVYYGDRRSEAREGHGVFVDPDGGGYEGSWRSGAPDGFGVVWAADGSVRAQGLWSGNTLVEPRSAPEPEALSTAAADAAPDDAAPNDAETP